MQLILLFRANLKYTAQYYHTLLSSTSLLEFQLQTAYLEKSFQASL